MFGKDLRLRAGIAYVGMGVLDKIDLPFFGRNKGKSVFLCGSVIDLCREGYCFWFVTEGTVRRNLFCPFFRSAFSSSFPSFVITIFPSFSARIACHNLLEGFAAFLKEDGAFKNSTLMMMILTVKLQHW